MRELELRIAEDWQKLIDKNTGVVIAEGHHLDAIDVLEALGFEYSVVDVEED